MNPLAFPLVKVLGAVLIATLLALAGTGWLLRGQFERNGALVAEMQQLQATNTALLAARKADGRALTRLRKENAATARAAASARRSLEAAKAAEPTWATQPVPQAIQEALNAEPTDSGHAPERPSPGVLRGRDPTDDEAPAPGESPG